jgi:hypothetical protein
MIPIHSLFSNLTQREVRRVHILAASDSGPSLAVPPDEYV